jgi:hypothetical protein
MIRRVGSVLLVAIIALVACAGNGHLVASQPVHAKRAEILLRDIGWVHDSIPLLRFDPPHQYHFLRAQVELCSGIHRDGWPRLYVAPINVLPGGHGGFYASDSDVIVFALGYEAYEWPVRHELLHFVLEPHIPPAPPVETEEEADARVHPPEFFARETGKCGAYVNPPRP